MATAKFRLGPNQRRWLKMLETTRRKQCRGTLHDGKGYCCLGIAELSLGKTPRALRHCASLSDEAVRALGLHDEYGDTLSDAHDACSSLNDSDRLTFKEIATHLRGNAATYFKRNT